MPERLRRSTRERKKVESIYDSAEKAGPTPKRKVQKSRSDVDDDEDDDDRTDPAPPSDEDEGSRNDDDETTSESSAEESEAEEPPPKRQTLVKSPRPQPTPRRTSVASSSGTKKPPKAAPVTVRKKTKAKTGGGGTKKATAVAVSGPLNRRQAIAALKTLEKKYIPDPGDETEENSLFVALISSYNHGEATKKNKRGVTDDNDSFYTAGLRTIVQRVMEEHSENATATEVKLFNLILRSVGGDRDSLLDPEEHDLENLSNDDFDDLITKIMSDMENVAVDRTPFIANTLKLTNAQIEFRKIFGEFWYRLAQTTLTVESNQRNNERFRVETARDLVTHLLDFLSVGQSDVRMAVAMAVYQMSKAMLERTVELKSKLTTAERQLNVAKKSKQERKREALERQIESWKHTVDDLEAFVDLVVQTVVVKRYRDSSQFIRVLTLETLTDFCTIRPDMYVTNMYLKYFGWMLSDYDPGVRKAAVQGLLIPLEKGSADTDAMDKVLAKFLGRLTDMTADVDLDVQETAMALLLKLLRSDFFENVDDDSIWDRINSMSLDIDATPTFRRDALSFVLEQIEEFDDGTATTERKAVDQLAKLSQWLAGVLCDGDIPLDEIEYERADLVVSALRAIPEHAPLASNWSAMLQALKNDKNPRKSSSNNQRIEMVQQRVLLRMLVTAVKMEVGDAGNECATNVDPLLLEAVQEHQDALATVKPSTNAKSTKQKSKSDIYEELTIALLRSLPDLLLRFKSETPVLASLTTLPHYFLPNVLNLSRLKKDFESLCGNLSSIFLESTDPTTLGNCLFAIVSLAAGDHSRSDEALVVLKDLANTLRDRLGELFEEHARLAKKNADDEESDCDDDEPSAADVASSIHQCIRRLCVLAKRWPLTDLLTGDNNDQKLESLSESIHTFMVNELRSRIIISEQAETQDTAATLNIPAVWQQNDNVHVDVAGSIAEGMQLLLVLAAWRLSEEIEIIEAEGEDYSEEQLTNHIVVRLRDRLKTVICLCYEHFVSESSMEYLSKPILDFSYSVQSNALKASADLRSLLLKKWLKAESKFLQACALSDDSVLIGAGVRFVHQQSQRLRANQLEDESDERIQEWESFLLPMGRGLSSNWEVANRREGAVVLAQITGSGGATQEMVQHFSRLFKKLHFVRLLEAQMACLRENFEAWAEGEPEEIGDRPTDREMAAYEEALQAHRDSFAEMLGLATRFSASLGVGRLKDKSMVAGLFGFLREGVRFAFSTNDPGSKEDLPLGCRLSFLSLTSKYLSWIRKDRNLKVEFGNYLNQLEAEMRSHEDYADIYPEDEMILVEFRKQADLGEYHVEEESATYHNASQSRMSSLRPARNSLGSSVSSIPSKNSKQGSLESIEEEPEDKSGAGTPSPTTRSFVPSSARTFGSVSSLGTRETRESVSPAQRPKRKARANAVHGKKSSARSGVDFGDDDESPKKRRKSQQAPSEDENSEDDSLTSPAKQRRTNKATSKMAAASLGKRPKVDAPESSDGSPSVDSKFTEATKGSASSDAASNQPSPSAHSRAESVAHSEALPSIRSTNDDDSLMESSDESSV